jgi:non-heme chloroperoxidase
MDVKGFGDYIGLQSADYCVWSMGAAILWSYIDLFGTKGIRKIAFIDEAPSVYMPTGPSRNAWKRVHLPARLSA